MQRTILSIHSHKAFPTLIIILKAPDLYIVFIWQAILNLFTVQIIKIGNPLAISTCMLPMTYPMITIFTLFHLFMCLCVSLCVCAHASKCHDTHSEFTGQLWGGRISSLLLYGSWKLDLGCQTLPTGSHSTHFELLVCSRYTCYSIKQPGVTLLLLY